MGNPTGERERDLFLQLEHCCVGHGGTNSSFLTEWFFPALGPEKARLYGGCTYVGERRGDVVGSENVGCLKKGKLSIDNVAMITSATSWSNTGGFSAASL